MGFTEEEKRTWHEQKRECEQRPELGYRPNPIAVCIHCQNPFGIGEGMVSDEGALCDVCSGD